jgi:3-oxoacyl-[acyl-carrier-protein] synthase I
MTVFIQDFGVISCAGVGVDSFYRHLLNHDQRLFSQSRQLSSGSVRQVGKVNEDFPGFPINLGAFYSRTNHLVYAALLQISEAIKEVKDKYAPERIGVVMGTCTSGSTEIDRSRAYEKEYGQLPDGYDYSVEFMDNTANFVKHYLQSGGPAVSVSTACTSSGKALAMAKRYLENNMLDAVIVGGADSYALAPLNGFESLASLSEQYCTPFGANRDGINIGEGAAIFVLTREPSALAIVGTGESSDAYHMSSPDPEATGAELAVRQALREAQLEPDDIGYINLHGTGTVANDAMESLLVNRVFGEHTPCSSTKNITGHTLGAASAIELAACAAMLKKGDSGADGQAFELIPQYADYAIDEELAPINLVKDRGTTSKPFFLSTSYAFGGSNCCLIIARQ